MNRLMCGRPSVMVPVIISVCPASGGTLQKCPPQDSRCGFGSVRRQDVWQAVYRNLGQNALALNAQHRAAERTAHLARVLRKFGAADRGFGCRAEFGNQIRIADQLIGEVLAVLKQIDSGFHQGRIGFETRQPLGIRQNFFEERLETITAPARRWYPTPWRPILRHPR